VITAIDERIVRRVEIGTRRLVVMDDVFRTDDIDVLYQFLQRLPYRLDDVDTDQTAYSRHWKAELPTALIASNGIFRQCVSLTHELMKPGAYEPERVHSNLHLYGDMQFPHVDLAGGVTALYYANPEWDEKWLGETIFYNEDRDPQYAVAPRPGRLVVFDGDIVHRGGVPSRECYQPRISVAFKFVPAPPADSANR